MRRESRDVLLPLSDWRGIASGGSGKCPVKMKLRRFEM